MKKVLVFFMLLIAAFGLLGLKAYADTTEPYVYTSEEGETLTVVLNEEDKTYVATITTEEGTSTSGGTYEILKDNIYILTDSNDGDSIKLKLNDDQSIEYYYDPCNVVIKTNGYGEVMTDIVKGEVGDICTIQASPSLLCELISLTVNGTKIVANNNGLYQFALVEGENKIEATFEISNEKVSEIVGIMENVKNNGFESLFTPNNLIILIALVIEVFLGGSFFVTLLKSKKIKAKTTNDVETTVTNVLNEKTKEAIANLVKEYLGPIFESYNIDITDIKSSVSRLVECMILAQENTPEARLAITKHLVENDAEKNELAEKVKNMIKAEIEKNEKSKQETKETLEELEKANNSLVEPKKDVVLDVVEDNNDVEGRY